MSGRSDRVLSSALHHRLCRAEHVTKWSEDRFSSTAGVPGEFDVAIRHKGESRRARIVWRNETEAGIESAGLESNAVVSIESARRIRKLEADKEALSRRVAQLSEPA
jgi:hypothetical protein